MGLLNKVRNHWRMAALALACLLGIATGISGSGVGLDRAIHQFGWSVRQHDASGEVHIVEIDARSIAAIDHWPWPRGHYARLVDHLREAGAASIAFDVDFSSPSAPAQDAALAAALARAGDKVVLPTFSQHAGTGAADWADSLPIAPLRDHAVLAAVTVQPDSDGFVRRMPVGTFTAGTPRPSLSAMVAGIGGAADSDFPIDFAIAPVSIPRHSFVDIGEGRFDPAAVRGKAVLIGATAVELGDRYAVPNHGVVPGVVIQALAAETLRRGVPRESGWQLPLVLALALGVLIVHARTRLRLAAALAVAPATLMGAGLALDGLLHWIFPLAPALVTIAVTGIAAVTMRLLAAARRRRLHDGETGLPNRHALRDALRSYAGEAVLAAHIADYEKLAAGLGAAATAELVKRVRDRVALVSQGSTIYRIEDRVLAWRCYDKADLEQRMATLRTAMLNPIDVAGRRVDVTIAIGLAEEAGADDRTIAHAGLAAAHALASGSGWHVHHADDGETVDRELSLLGELDEAVARGGIHVVYQPKLDLATDRIVSVEALVRWQHPTRGFMRPDLFIPLAERNDRIAGLTLHVLGQTIEDLRSWRAAGHVVTGAVNVSAKLLNSPEFIASLRTMVERSAVDPAWLTFEVTESAAMSDPEGAARALHSFREMGIAISMDDYGTGQSTLSYLKQLPLNELKIDRSFVQFAHQNRGDGVLVRSTVDLAHELGLKVVAEGVEDAECLAFLRGIGCDMVQGYFVSRPIGAADLKTLLAGRSLAA
ncbi:EAL domain-containing protein [Sphingomonas sp. DG1-23]|uniref:putative bifunctional diguanylate cyclase/phosphodiesterase n=1 Tax=Sphingomonas sp. DG1-23 TaxID=3068316 RepID=UPI00273D97E3|nr:EAL domain-containing protein [Sphingomonas sp. DG1-23]MDP5277865.1 EAL domain-containing protein [Sphingomonas sp. DG1-23]